MQVKISKTLALDARKLLQDILKNSTLDENLLGMAKNIENSISQNLFRLDSDNSVEFDFDIFQKAIATCRANFNVYKLIPSEVIGANQKLKNSHCMTLYIASFLVDVTNSIIQNNNGISESFCNELKSITAELSIFYQKKSEVTHLQTDPVTAGKILSFFNNYFEKYPKSKHDILHEGVVTPRNY